MNTGSYNDSLGGGYAAGANPNAVLMHDDGGFEREVSAPSSAGAHPNQRSHWHSGRNGEMERAFSVIASVGNTAVSSSRQSGDGGLFSGARLLCLWNCVSLSYF